MSRQHHYLKTVNPYFAEIDEGRKRFEVRFNDRGYQTGDILHLQEFIPPATFTGREIQAEVTCILDNPQFCKDGYVTMSINPFWMDRYENDDNP